MGEVWGAGTLSMGKVAAKEEEGVPETTTRSQMRPAWGRFLGTALVAHPALCTEDPCFGKIGDISGSRMETKLSNQPETVTSG
jgi:hypothetical protein